MASETMSPLATGEIVRFQQAVCMITDIQKALEYNQYHVVHLSTGCHPRIIQLPADQRPCTHGSHAEKPYGRCRFWDGSHSCGPRGGDDQQCGGCQKSVGWMFRDGSHQVGWKQTFRQNCEVYRLGRAAFRGRWSLPKWMCEMGEFRRNKDKQGCKNQ